MSRLLVSLGSLPLLSFKVPGDCVRLGRDPANDIVLSLPEAADFHAEITRQGGRAYIRSSNGEAVLVNGRATEGALLCEQDMITLGGYRLQWLTDEGSRQEPTGSDPEPSASHPTIPLLEPEGAANRPVSRLVVTGGRDAGLELPFNGPTLIVGRAPDSDLVLGDETVSWRHLSLERAPEGIRVRDLASRNGTFLDGRRIESAITGAGSSIRTGRTHLRLAGPAAAVSREAPAADSSGTGLAELVGRSPAIQRVYGRIREAAASRVPVLLLGETGTGKELAARAIHAIGSRARGPFVPVNCAAVARELIEDELFGHARGAFTGATGERRGAFEAADGGTVFLDEIGELPLDLQPKLLRVIEDGHVPRLGGGGRPSDFRILAASNRDLSQEVAAGRFRRDLFYRLAVCEIRMPALSDRLEDLGALTHVFLRSAEQHTGVPGAHATRFEEAAFTPLREHAWPGNVRELRNLILRAVTRRPAGVVDRALVEELLAEGAVPEGRPSSTLEAIQVDAVRNALRDCDGSRRAAARRLGIAESTLYEKIRRYGLGGAPPEV
ncbi:MAG: sigma 54-interacting transcriptional regulator [Gemmatimonadales bacterium]